MKAAADFLTGDKSIADRLCDFIIRPPRAQYKISDLGPRKFRLSFTEGSPYYVRRDLTLYNMRGMRIESSWYVPGYFGETPEDRSSPPVDAATGKRAPTSLPCVVFCHANCGSRYDGLEALFLLEHGFSVFTFDFCGSGKSEGEYISLGISERQDLAAVVEYLSLEKEVSGIALWGRSMGAVTSIMYASKDPYLRCIVCDSPFASLDMLIRDIVATRISRFFPDMITRAVVERLRRNIERRAEVDIAELETTKYAQHCRVPCFLIHGSTDDFVDVKHTMRIRDFFPEDVACLHEIIPGGHNSQRDEAHPLIIAFLRTYLVEKPQANSTRYSHHNNSSSHTAVTDTTTVAPVSSPEWAANSSTMRRGLGVGGPAPHQATTVQLSSSVAAGAGGVLYGEEGEEDASLLALYEAESSAGPLRAVGGVDSGTAPPSVVVQGRVVASVHDNGTAAIGGHHHLQQRQRQFSEDPPSLLEETTAPNARDTKQQLSLTSLTNKGNQGKHEDPSSFDFTEQQKPIEFSKPQIFE